MVTVVTKEDRRNDYVFKRISRIPSADPDVFDPDCEPVSTKVSCGPFGSDLDELSF